MKIYAKWLLPLMLIPILTFGCGKSNAIKLTYILNSTDFPCSGNVVVFKFADKRTTTNLGKTTDKSVISALSDVSEWVSWALFDELENAGCKAKFRTTAVMPEDDLVVSGEILDVALNQTGVTTYKGMVSVRIVVTKAGKTVHVQKYTSEVEDVVVPGYSTESDILAEALGGVMIEAVPAIANAAK